MKGVLAVELIGSRTEHQIEVARYSSLVGISSLDAIHLDQCRNGVLLLSARHVARTDLLFDEHAIHGKVQARLEHADMRICSS